MFIIGGYRLCNRTVSRGPGEVVFSDARSLATAATFTVAGVYVLELSGEEPPRRGKSS